MIDSQRRMNRLDHAMPPAFSVIMPAYNCESTIEDSIRSVCTQTCEDLELLVIDDCSSDETASVIRRCAAEDPRIRLISLQKNAGVASARNVGIDAARGRFITFLDADDLWLPHKLETQLNYFRNGHRVLFSSYIRFDATGTERIITAPERVDFHTLLKGNCIGNLTGAYDSQSIGKVFQRPIGHEDYLMWLQIVKIAGSAVGIPDTLARYRVAPNSLSSNKLKAARWTWQIYRQHLQLGWLKSAQFFALYTINAFRKRL